MTREERQKDSKVHKFATAHVFTQQLLAQKRAHLMRNATKLQMEQDQPSAADTNDATQQTHTISQPNARPIVAICNISLVLLHLYVHHAGEHVHNSAGTHSTSQTKSQGDVGDYQPCPNRENDHAKYFADPYHVSRGLYGLSIDGRVRWL